MNGFSKFEQSVGRKTVKFLCSALFAAALFLLPATARADSGGTYDLTGTFSNGVTINNGSTFSYSGTSLAGASITTSTDGSFDCPADATGNTCTLYVLSNGTDEFGINNGSYYLVLVFPTSDLGTLGPFDLTAGSSYIRNDATGSTAYFLSSGTAALVTPEPATWLLMLSGLAGLFFLGLRRVHA